jgi:pimeloyl-ACP methyl ester carboxylesterase
MVRPRLVLVHGIRTSASMWRAQLEDLADAGYEASAIDLPGHGRRMSEAFTSDAAVAAIDESVTASPGPVLLVGLSLGGYLSIEYAGRHGDRIAGLVAAACGSRSRGVGLTGYRMLAAGIHRLPDRGRWLNDTMARAFVGAGPAADIVAGGVALDVMGPTLKAMAQLDQLVSIAAYDGPIWFVNGRLDHFRLEEQRMLSAARDGRLVVVPGATHLVSLVRPRAFTDVLVAAAQEVDERTG